MSHSNFKSQRSWKQIAILHNFGPESQAEYVWVTICHDKSDQSEWASQRPNKVKTRVIPSKVDRSVNREQTVGLVERLKVMDRPIFGNSKGLKTNQEKKTLKSLVPQRESKVGHQEKKRCEETASWYFCGWRGWWLQSVEEMTGQFKSDGETEENETFWSLKYHLGAKEE